MTIMFGLSDGLSFSPVGGISAAVTPWLRKMMVASNGRICTSYVERLISSQIHIYYKSTTQGSLNESSHSKNVKTGFSHASYSTKTCSNNTCSTYAVPLC